MAKQAEIRFRSTEEFKKQVERLAAKHNRTVSNYIETLLKEQIEKEGLNQVKEE